MVSIYREIVPTSNLSRFVECFWTNEVRTDECRRILPDGCLDFLFFGRGRQIVDSRVVGVMTHPHDVQLHGGQSILGIRFHPGMASPFLPCDIASLNDQSIPIQAMMGTFGASLLSDLRGATCVETRIERLKQRFKLLPEMNRVQAAIRSLAHNKGRLSVAKVAECAEISVRQLRRWCYRHSGLSPILLARILRFREAATRLRSDGNDLSKVSLDCGYFDQAHMNRDFREFAGVSPARFLRRNCG